MLDPNQLNAVGSHDPAGEELIRAALKSKVPETALAAARRAISLTDSIGTPGETRLDYFRALQRQF
ncbi:hypothetical protein KC992_02885 [Candidatus Saccharibacteria bacterium]|nr:hypothetical protein [Candidatus Saccharibacteria bacterium]MCA9328291.1 hypothetical protein [Candidatus Saccharibacteria bacterium]